MITNHSVNISNGLHSSLSVTFLSTPRTYFCSTALFSIFPLLPILCLSMDCAFIISTGHLFLLCRFFLLPTPSVYFSLYPYYSHPCFLLWTYPAIVVQKAIKYAIKPERATSLPSMILLIKHLFSILDWCRWLTTSQVPFLYISVLTHYHEAIFYPK